MSNFFNSIWPTTIPPHIDSNNEIAVLQERLLQMVLLSILAIAAIVLALVVPTYIQAGQWATLILYLAGLAYIFIIAIFRRISYTIRAVSAALISYALCTGSLLVYGLSGSGPVFMLGFIAITMILLGLWPGVTAAITTMMTMWMIGSLMAQNIYPAPSLLIQNNSTNPVEWIGRGAVVTAIGGFFIAAFTTLIDRINRSLLSQKELTAELTIERDTLENRVQQRTVELQHRSLEMETASRIARDISQITNLDELLPKAVELIKSNFNLYYVALFLVDERREFAILKSGTGEAGTTMLAMNHRLKLAETSMVGYSILKNENRLAQDVDQDPVHYHNPLLAETRSELSMPLTVGDEAIGALNLQSIQPRYFMPDDIRVLQITVDQLAVAIDKARLVQQLTKTLDELQTSYRQTTQQSWQGFLQLARRSFAYNYRQGNLSTDSPKSLHASQALMLGQPVFSHSTSPETGNPVTHVAVPIKLRDQVLGVLDLHFDMDRVPPNLLETLEAASNRLALALDNARLLEEIQLRAAREHMVSNISSKVRAESEVEKVLQTVVAELGRSLGVSDVLVQLRDVEG
jgi:GAF domain-containing protein